MSQFVGSVVMPNQSNAPASPVKGQMYFDTDDNQLYWWNGSTWVGGVGTIYDSDQISTIKTFAGTTIPTNWMLADGRSLLRTDYPDLFTAIGTTYGAVDGTHFSLPDLRSNFIYGATAANTQGAGGGETSHLLTSAESGLRDHDHNLDSMNMGSAGPTAITQSGKTNITGRGGAGSGSSLPALVASSGFYYGLGVGNPTNYGASLNASAAHNNMPPYIVLAYIIKVTGAQIDSGGALVGPQGIQGVQGPQGAQGDIGPQGPQGIQGTFAVADFPVFKKAAASAGTRTGITTTVEMYDAANRDMRLGPFTPNRNCWWEVTYNNLLIPADATWVRCDVIPVLMADGTTDTTRTDADGLTNGYDTLVYWNNSAGPYYSSIARAMYKLTAGQTYWVRAVLARNTGTWGYYLTSTYFTGWAKVAGFW